MWYKQVLASELESALFYPGAFDIKINGSFTHANFHKFLKIHLEMFLASRSGLFEFE